MKKVLLIIAKELPGGFVDAVGFLAKQVWATYLFFFALIVTLLVGAELQRQGITISEDFFIEGVIPLTGIWLGAWLAYLMPTMVYELLTIPFKPRDSAAATDTGQVTVDN